MTRAPDSPSTSQIPRTPRQARDSHLESERWRRVLIWGLKAFPPPLQRATMPLWSAFFYAQVPRARRAIQSNLSRLLGLRPPQLQVAAYRTFTNYCQSIADAYLPYVGLDPGLGVELRGAEHLRRILRPGLGAILTTGHLGSWQLGPHYLDEHGFPPVTVVMTEEPDRGTQQLVAGLRDREARVVYPGRSPLLALELRAALLRGELVAFQMDRPSTDTGLPVPFAGGTATFAAGPAVLARTCDAPVVPVFFPVLGRRLRIQVEPPLRAPHTDDREADIRALTAELARVYERVVRCYPEQWFNFYDFFSGSPA